VLAAWDDAEIRRWMRPPPPDAARALAYVRSCENDWADDARYTWAVCAPTTGEMLGEIALAGVDLLLGTAEVSCWALPVARRQGMTTAALGAVLRFAFGALVLHRVEYSWAAPNAVSARVAAACGFTVEGRRREAWPDGEGRVDLMLAGRLAHDP